MPALQLSMRHCKHSARWQPAGMQDMMRIVMQDVGPRRANEDAEEDPEVLEDEEEQVCVTWQWCEAARAPALIFCKQEVL